MYGYEILLHEYQTIVNKLQDTTNRKEIANYIEQLEKLDKLLTSEKEKDDKQRDSIIKRLTLR